MADEEGSVEGFVRRIKRRAATVSENANKATKDAARAMLEEVVRATPADTGRARSNWKVGVGVPAGGVRGPYAPGKKLGLGETANADAAVKAGKTRISTAPQDAPLFISNNVDYIAKLNAGSSSQAPANFIERALERGAATARRARLLRDGN